MKEPRESLLKELKEIKDAVKDATDMPESIVLKNELIRMIGAGILIEGDRLPGVYDMGDIMDINRQTAYKTYKSLQQEGYISIKRQEGAIVHVTVSRRDAMAQLRENLKNALSQAYAANLTFDEATKIFEADACEMHTSRITKIANRKMEGDKK